MRLARILFCLAATGIWAVALSRSTFIKDFEGTYGVKTDGKVGKAACVLDHLVKSPMLNPYGPDVQKAMTQENANVLAGSVPKKVEGLET